MRKKFIRLALSVFITLFFATRLAAAEIKVMTFNTWGISDGRDKKERFALIGKEVGKLGPDLVVFEEVFEEWERAALKSDLVQAGFPADNFRYFPFRSYGTGIFVASRWPISESRLEPYIGFTRSSNKESLGRAMTVCRIAAPSGDLLFFNTHITPGNLADLSRSEAMLEFFELARLVYAESARTGVKRVIVAGDLNADAVKMIYSIFPALSGLENAWDAVHPGEPGYTNDRRTDPYTIMGIERIDHIFYGNLTPGPGLAPVKAEVVFDYAYSAPNGKKYFLSDHFGVTATFEIKDNPKVIRDAPILQRADLSSDDKKWLSDNLKRGSRLGERRDVWTRLGLAVLVDQDRAERRDARLVEAADRLLIELVMPGKFPPAKQDYGELLKWLEKK